MFYVETSTLLGSGEYSKFFPNIRFEANGNTPTGYPHRDNVLMTMMRVMLTEPRLKSSAGLQGILIVTPNELNVEGMSENDVRKVFVDDFRAVNGDASRTLVLVLPKDGALVELSKKYIDGTNGFKLVEDMSVYVDKDGNTNVFQNPDKKMTVVFAPKSKATKVMHGLASMMPRVFPWCFDGENKPSADDIALMKSITEDTSDNFTKMAQSIFDSYDFKGNALVAAFDGFCRSDIDERIQNITEKINDCDSDIAEFMKRIANNRENVERLMNEQTMLRIKQACGTNDDDEVVSFLKNNKAVHFIERSGNYIYLCFHAPLDSFNEDMRDNYLFDKANRGSYVYKHSPFGTERTKKLFKAIWGDSPMFSLNTYCVWKMSTNASISPTGTSYAIGEKSLIENRMPQPHIWDFRCIRGYENMLGDAYENRDYTGAIAIAMQSCHSINWGDSCVVDRLMKNLFVDKKNTKCLWDAAGNHYTAAEALEILEKESAK